MPLTDTACIVLAFSIAIIDRLDRLMLLIRSFLQSIAAHLNSDRANPTCAPAPEQSIGIHSMPATLSDSIPLLHLNTRSPDLLAWGKPGLGLN